MIIQPMTINDAPALYRWISEDQAGALGQFLPFLQDIQSPQDEEQFLTRMLSLDTVRMWTIRTDEHGVIGEILLHSYDAQARTAKLGYWLARPFRQQGYTSEALRAVIAECTEITTLIIEVEAANTASQHTALKVGFEFVGVQRNDDGQTEHVYEWHRPSSGKSDS
jgi:RimJ/RimL family protein N-acetyltransferase